MDILFLKAQSKCGVVAYKVNDNSMGVSRLYCEISGKEAVTAKRTKDYRIHLGILGDNILAQWRKKTYCKAPSRQFQ